jgi:hypothetical protein
VADGAAGRAPLMVELDEETMAAQRGKVTPWLVTVGTLQSGFRRLLAGTVPLVRDPLVRDWLGGMERSAEQHEAAVDELFAAFELRRPVPHLATTVAGAALGTARAVAGQLQGLAGGASGVVSGAAWRNLRQLQLSNLDSMSAFAVAQQLGLALGRPRVVEIAFPVVQKKSEQHLVLQELFLEFASDAVLRGRGI